MYRNAYACCLSIIRTRWYSRCSFRRRETSRPIALWQSCVHAACVGKSTCCNALWEQSYVRWIRGRCSSYIRRQLRAQSHVYRQDGAGSSAPHDWTVRKCPKHSVKPTVCTQHARGIVCDSKQCSSAAQCRCSARAGADSVASSFQRAVDSLLEVCAIRVSCVVVIHARRHFRWLCRCVDNGDVRQFRQCEGSSNFLRR